MNSILWGCCKGATTKNRTFGKLDMFEMIEETSLKVTVKPKPKPKPKAKSEEKTNLVEF